MKQWYAANREKAQATNRASRQRHIEKVRAYDRERSRTLCETQPEKVSEKMHRHYLRHKEKFAANHQKKSLTRYWELKLARSLNMARKKGAEIIGLESLKEFYKQVFTQPSAICDYCHQPFLIRKITVDHKHSYKLGGKHEVSNLALSCALCNNRKGSRPYNDWMLYLERSRS